MDGPWIVLYTDAHPPSNGQLGPLKGVAKQVIDLQKGTYKNELYVGGSGADEDQNAWLSAVLEATWKEWDGVYLDNDDSNGENESGNDDLSFVQKKQHKHYQFYNTCNYRPRCNYMESRLCFTYLIHLSTTNIYTNLSKGHSTDMENDIFG